MLTILEVNPTGFFSYGQHITVPIDGRGIVELTGQNHDRLTRTANGSGKSSLLNTICHILFGVNPSGATDTSIVNSVWGNGAWGYIKYKSHTGRTYRVVVSRKWTSEYPDPAFAAEPSQIHIQNDLYGGTDLFFDEWNGQCWMDKRLTKIPETRKAILATLGMSYTQFLTTSYLAQQKGIQFVSGKNKDRMQIISELMDLSIWDKANKIGRTKLASLTEVVLKLKGSIEGKQSALASMPKPMLPEDLEIMQMGMLVVQADKDEAQSSLELLEFQLADIAADRQAHGSKAATLQNLQRSVLLQHGIANKNLMRLTAERDQAINKVLSRKVDDSAHIREAAEISAEIRHIDRLLTSSSGPGLCDKCGSAVSEDHCTRRALGLREQEAILVSRLQEITTKMQDMVADLENQNIVSVLNIEMMYDGQLEAAHAESQALAAQANEVANQIIAASVPTELDTRMREVQQEQAKFRTTVDQCSRALDAAKFRLQAETQAATHRAQTLKTIEADTATLKTLEEEALALAAIIKGTSDKGIKAHKFGSIIDSLNGLVKEYIEILTDGQVHVWFTPWREKSSAKTGDDVVAEVQILVKEGPKDEVDLDLYSGAERQQITLAIICAFWRLATQAGGGTNILFLDEIFGMFDAPTAGLVVNLLNKLRETHFGTIVVVTHDTKVSDMIKYDGRWVAIKKEHITTLQTEAT